MRDIGPARPSHSHQPPHRHVVPGNTTQRPSSPGPAIPRVVERPPANRRNTLVFFYFAGPTLGIILSVIAFAVVSFLVNSGAIQQGGTGQTLANTLIFILGALSVSALPIGIILGIIDLSKRKRTIPATHSSASAAEMTLEASRGWNWGAFWLTWIWGVANGVPKSLWVWVPLWGFVYAFILGAKGNQWAWESGQWDSVEEFRSSQRKWAIWGLVVVGVIFVLYVLAAAAGSGSTPSS